MRRALARLLVFAVLEMGAVCGVPMSPEQIEKLMQVMTRTKISCVMRNEIDGE